MSNKTKYAIATADCETDPFLTGRVPEPFAFGVYHPDGTFLCFWGDDCIDQFIAYTEDLKQPTIFHFHNGGRFDFFYLLEFLSGEPVIIGSRIVECSLGRHKVRDSFAMIPEALGRYKKTEIDYALFERNVRQRHRRPITSYLKDDCVYLMDLVLGFRERFGDKLTCGSAAIAELKKHHKFDRIAGQWDAMLRPYYFGGRVECFHIGRYDGPVEIYDVNSMYPSVMRSMRHPIGGNWTRSKAITSNTFFLRLRAKNYGALPMRQKNGPLRFDVERGEFHCTIHEYLAGIETGTLEPLQILETIHFDKHTTFAAFIDYWYERRLEAKARGDAIDELFCKRVMNAAYGKFATNPERFYDYMILDGEVAPKGWEIDSAHGSRIICKQKAVPKQSAYFNIATGASITGAARSVLLRALSQADTPLYCDTDSIIARELHCDKDAKRLGAWKTEASGDEIHIAGKKTYAVFSKGSAVKFASKGVRLTPDQIADVAAGEIVEHVSDVPTFKMSGKHIFQKRRVRITQSEGHAFGKR